MGLKNEPPLGGRSNLEYSTNNTENPIKPKDAKRMSNTIIPHGGALTDLIVDPEEAENLRTAAVDITSVTLSQRQVCDLELLMNGGFSPLSSFMNRADYQAVVDSGRLADGTLWPIPVVLDVSREAAEKLVPGQKLALRDGEGFMLAVATVGETWEPDKSHEAESVYGTSNAAAHPGVKFLFEHVNDVYVDATIEGIQLPVHHEFETLWDTPEELRNLFAKLGWRKVLAFQTSKPIHRIHRETILDIAKQVGAHILLHPTVGMTKPGDLNYYARVHCYQAVRRHFPHNLAMLSLLPLAMRMAGPREALWNAIVHQNYGCSQFIIGPDEGSPPRTNGGESFYPSYAAQEYVGQFADELQIEPVAIEERRYVPSARRFLPVSEIQEQNLDSAGFSHDEFRRRLSRGEAIPEWYSYPEVVDELRRIYPPRGKQGFTLFFTGLSGSGKSTLAKIIYAKLIEEGNRPVTLLDGDIVRLNLSSELGFSKAHRDLNIRRIGFVANEITKNGGVAICAPIAPYRATRRAVRAMIEEGGAFIEIHVATPLETCEARDRKGLYAKARKGIIPEFTGVSDPYEEPARPELRIDTTAMSPMEAAQDIFLYLVREGYLDRDDTHAG